MDLATVDHLLTTTRSVKKRMDFCRPVEHEVIAKCIETALYAPTGRNFQDWHFIVVTDPEKRKCLADLYRKGYRALLDTQGTDAPPTPWPEGDVRRGQHDDMMDASNYLYDHMHDVPAHVIACMDRREGDMANISDSRFESFRLATLYGSILPAAWSIMLALRARGLGASWTTAHLICEKEVADLLGIPDNVMQAALLPVAYFKGTGFKPLKRRPVETVTHWNGWDGSR